jgi:predicted PurR-regulated permease PerM
MNKPDRSSSSFSARSSSSAPSSSNAPSSSSARSSSSTRTAAILVVGIALLYLAREILIPLAFAITLTLILAPAVAWFEKILRLSRVPSVLLVMILAMAVAGSVSFVIFNQLVGIADDLPVYRKNIDQKIEAMRRPGKSALQRAAESVKELSGALSGAPAGPAQPAPNPADRLNRRNASDAGGPTPVQVIEPPVGELQYVRDLIQPFLAPLAMLGITLVFTVFLLIELTDLRNRIFRLAGLSRLNVMTQALEDAAQRVSRYLALQITVNVAFGILFGTGLYLIGVPYAALWGGVAAILRMVPYLGSAAAALSPFLLALAVFDRWGPPLLVLVLFGALEVVTANLIEPWLYGTQLGISSLALLLTAVFWATLWGPAGLILSTPLTVCLVVLGRYIPQLSFLHVLLGDQQVLAPEAQVYQRLLAMDDQEARAAADRYLGQYSLVQLYDSVMIPVLSLVEQDRHKGALPPSREEFLLLSVREMLAEFSERTPKIPIENGAAPRGTPAGISDAPRGRVICLPANDEADEIAAAMLTQLLQQAGHAALSFPLEESLLYTIGMVQPGEADLFCISAVPPFAFARAKALSGQLQLRFPRTKILVGVWGFTGDPERALRRFEPSSPNKLVTTLADAIRFAAGGDPVPEESLADDYRNSS